MVSASWQPEHLIGESLSHYHPPQTNVSDLSASLRVHSRRVDEGGEVLTSNELAHFGASRLTASP